MQPVHARNYYKTPAQNSHALYKPNLMLFTSTGFFKSLRQGVAKFNLHTRASTQSAKSHGFVIGIPSALHIELHAAYSEV